MEDIFKKITVFEGDLSGLQTGTVKKGVGDFAWNQHLFVPLENNSKIYAHPNQEGVYPNYIRIIHSDYNCVAIFNKSYFSFD